MELVSQWEFDIYALSLPRGHAFGNEPPIGAWRSKNGITLGILIQNQTNNNFGFLIMRRRRDSVWVVIDQGSQLKTQDEALSQIETHLASEAEREPVPNGVAARPALHDLKGRTPSDVFNLLRQPSHTPAAWTLNQLYLALPKPDKNWAGDCQTRNFHTRMWEAQLLASLREQGLFVTQPEESPDFRIENSTGDVAWIEAVTANPSVPYDHVNAKPTVPPTDREEIFFGSAALRFAKTLGNKIDRQYPSMPHVAGYPFVLALADFQAPASMVWSREGLIGYLYGAGAQAVEVDGKLQAVPLPATHLLGEASFPAGLFRNDQNADVSAVTFTNACSLAKLNRVAVTGQGAPKGLRYTRFGNFFDRTPDALKGIPFCLDITSDAYRNLWPQGYEPWTAELEVFHNPFAKHPLPFELMPEATHWFDHEGEIICASHYEHSILWSRTLIQNESDPPFRLEDILGYFDPPP
jgi:hypothetical protein